MHITNVQQVSEFLAAADHCVGGVKLISPYGDVYNLKSKLSQFVAIGALLGEHGSELHLICDEETDEKNFIRFFRENPEAI
jgi:hypothetical protein